MARSCDGARQREQEERTTPVATLPSVDKDFGDCTALDALDRLIDPKGLDLVDIGCGAGDLARHLAGRGARVTAVEPDPDQARENAGARRMPSLTFVQTGAENLPLADGSVDGAFFSKSLHHVPPAVMPAALGEAIRVLRTGGFLYVLEPDIDGAFSRLMLPFHDETKERRQALACLAEHARPAFAAATVAAISVERRYADFDAFADAVLSLTYNAYRREDVEAPDVRACFEAGRDGAGYAFRQPLTIYLFRDKSADA